MWTSVKLFFSSRKRYLVAFFGTLFKQIMAAGGAALVEASRNAVKVAEASGAGKSGEEKLKIARDYVIGELAAQGFPIVLNAINAAIEAAVAEMKDAA